MAEQGAGQIGRAKLHLAIIQAFNQPELRALCFELAIDYDDLPPGGRSDKAWELIAYCGRTGRLRTPHNHREPRRRRRGSSRFPRWGQHRPRGAGARILLPVECLDLPPRRRLDRGLGAPLSVRAHELLPVVPTGEARGCARKRHVIGLDVAELRIFADDVVGARPTEIVVAVSVREAVQHRGFATQLAGHRAAGRPL